MGRTRPSHRTMTISAVGALLLIAAPAAWTQDAPDPEAVRRDAVSAVETRRAAQATLDRWAEEKSRLFDEMDRMEAELRRIRWERRQTEAFIADLSGKAADLSAREAEADALRDRIGPLLDETFARLSAHVEADLPFAAEERNARLERIRRSLDNADAGIPERTRTLLDAVKAEVEAGYVAGADAADIDIHGNAVRVRRLHVGRLGLFALSPDHRSAWGWNPETAAWIAMPEHAPALADAVRIADGHRLAELVALPLSPPDSAEGEGK